MLAFGRTLIYVVEVERYTVTACTVAGIVTFFESEMSRVAEVIRDLLLARPSREDLQRRHIYKGANFISGRTASRASMPERFVCTLVQKGAI